jgi:D-alanyl-D-alanine carboxypeptidase/D-alanyl-D-alanine-endopeptidase (penicillin-binding protein 4)
MLAASDNDVAEALAHLTALAKGEPATFAGGVTAVEAVLTDLGLPNQGLHLDDGSGLSRGTLVPPEMITGLLTLAAQTGRPDLRPLLTGLAVAGFTGSLANRFGGPTTRIGAGLVRAKTGTLTDVTAMAGIVQDASGRLLAFDFVADRVSPNGTLAARQALDVAASALAGCGCG